jgi:hypothetical protein
VRPERRIFYIGMIKVTMRVQPHTNLLHHSDRLNIVPAGKRYHLFQRKTLESCLENSCCRRSSIALSPGRERQPPEDLHARRKWSVERWNGQTDDSFKGARNFDGINTESTLIERLVDTRECSLAFLGDQGRGKNSITFKSAFIAIKASVSVFLSRRKRRAFVTISPG